MLMIGTLAEYGSMPPLKQGDYVYEKGFIVLGWMVTVLVVSAIVLGALKSLSQVDCQLKRVQYILRVVILN